MNGYYAILIEILKRHGCHFERKGRGDHEIWKTKSGKSLTVDRCGKSRHTANSVLKDAGITDEKI